MLRRMVTSVLMLQLALGAPAALLAAEPSAADVATAKNALKTGRVLREKGDHAGALAQFTAAYQLVPTPITGYELAAEQETMGLLVEARETALAVTRMEVKPTEKAEHEKARVDAANLANALAKRIPHVKVEIVGVPSGVTPRVKIDGVEVPFATLAAERALDPGKHTVVVSGDGFVEKTEEFTLSASESRDVVVTLTPEGTSDKTTEKPKTPITSDVSPAPTSTQSTIGWITMGVGAAVGITGLVVLGLGKSAYPDVPDECKSSARPVSCNGVADDADAANRTMRAGAIVGFVGAGLLLAGGALWLTAPSAKTPAVVSVGPSSVRVLVQF